MPTNNKIDHRHKKIKMAPLKYGKRQLQKTNSFFDDKEILDYDQAHLCD